MKRLFLLAFIWGWSFLFIKVAVEGMTPPTVAAIRVALGAGILLLLLHRRGEELPEGTATWRHLAFVAFVGNAVPFTLLAWGEERITSALTAVVNASTPLFTALFVAAILGDRLKRPQLAGLLLGFAGVAVAAGVAGSDLAGSSLAGVGAATAAGACYGLAFAWSKRHLMGLAPTVAAAGQLTAATVLLAPVAVVTSLQSGFEPTPTRVLAIVLLGVLGTGVAYVLSYRLIADIGATGASLVTYIVPVVAVTVGVLVLDEEFHVRLLLGGVMIVLGIALVQERLTRLRRVPVGATGVLLVLALLMVGCGDDDDTAATTSTSTTSTTVHETPTSTTAPPPACGPITDELEDPRTNHVLPGAAEPEYPSDAPTSGPHQVVPPDLGPVLTEPLPRPQQVGVLETGRVLVQVRADVDAATQQAVQALGGPDVVVAPNPDLSEPIIATAWRKKRTCDDFDEAALREFIAAGVDQTEGH